MAIYYPPPQPAQARPPSPQLAAGVWGDPPPLVSGARDTRFLWGILCSWNYPDPEPRQQIKLFPQLLFGTWGDQPPRAEIKRIQNIILSWEKDIPWVRMPSPLVMVQADDPPFSQRGPWIYRIVDAWEPAPHSAQWARQLSGSLLAVQINDPPFSLRLRGPGIYEVVYSWQPGPHGAQFPFPVAAIIPAPTEQDPPFYSRLRGPGIYEVVYSWQPGPHGAQFPFPVAAIIPPPTEQDPPFSNLLRTGPILRSIVEAWEPAPPILKGIITAPVLFVKPLYVYVWKRIS